ncbi:hypothetical protein ACKVMT_11810 [Halobacteriales archaeon Cl-PHB]
MEEFDSVATALSKRPRRHILVELLDRNPVDVTDISATTARDGAVRVAESERSTIALSHVHLPKLESMGYIDWNRDRRTIARGANWEEVETPVSVLNDHRDDMAVTWL